MPLPASRLRKPLEAQMQDFVSRENITQFRKLIAIAEADPNRDEARYQVLLWLLAEELGKAAAAVMCKLPRA